MKQTGSSKKREKVLSFLLSSAFIFSVAGQSYAPEQNNPKLLVQPSVPIEAYAFNLKDVRIGEGLFSKAMQLDATYLLSLKPDRLLSRFRQHAGLVPKDSIYGGWENLGVSGHSLGHYLSACAMMYASSGDSRFKERIDYIVDELALCQQKRGTGYVGAIPNEDSIFAQIKRGDIHTENFNLNGGWVPWYTIHKILAGLEDAYLYADNQKALQILKSFGGWIENITAGFSEAQWQKMLMEEHGGMNEVLANLYAFTGDKRYLRLAEDFYHKAILDPLASKEDQLAGKHANTQIPKVIGVSRLYELTGKESDQTIADFFWHTVVDHHSYVIGGNSDFEHFDQPDKLSDHLSANTTETCNTYNMLKLTRHLFSWHPSAAYMDYYERALYNHILASQNSNTGMMCYYVPLQSGTSKQFNTPFESFWCCTGTGMENHVKYGEQIYSEGKDGSLFINLFIPSSLSWEKRNLMVKQETHFPASDEGAIILDLKKSPQHFIIRLRKPYWASTTVIKINGQSEKPTIDKYGYIELDHNWKNGDRIEWQMSMGLHAESMPDNAARQAFLYGPLVLAASLPASKPGAGNELPVLVAAPGKLLPAIQKEAKALSFNTDISQPYHLQLQPFYTINDQRQMVYFDVYDSSGWKKYKAIIEEEQRRKATIEKRTVDVLRIGEMQPERDHRLKGEKTFNGEMGEHKWRDARDGGWFSFELNLPGDTASMILQCQYWGSDGGGREFDILVDDKKLTSETLTAAMPNKFIAMDYALPADMTNGKKSILIRFQAMPGKTAGGLFGCRILKAFD